MPIKPINMVEASVPEDVLDTRTGLRREILMVFNSWHKEPLTAEKIKVLLEAKGLAVKIETIYSNLEALEKNNILVKQRQRTHAASSGASKALPHEVGNRLSRSKPMLNTHALYPSRSELRGITLKNKKIITHQE